ARGNLQQIEKSAQRAAELAQQMLAYSGKGRFVIEPLDINVLITEMNHMLGVSISKKVSMQLNLAEKIPLFEGDATQMRQIIMNLVINASEAIGDDNGIITVTTGSIVCDRPYLATIWLYDKLVEGTYVFFEISDTGCGMDKETLTKLFDPFFTTKFTGRGLGMAAVMGIIRGHQGAINVYSEPGKGASFKVLLPAKQNISLTTSLEPAQLQTSNGSGTILLVDDEETLLTLGRDMLEELGYSVLTAADGVDALEVFKSHKEEIACIILDLTMPRLDGAQVIRELLLIDPNVRVILSSGYNELEIAQKFADKELAGFIQKPYRLAELSNILKEVIKDT
ncbi:MAG: response regulator, partial [Deltaproteobacteria bacterium]